MQHAAVETRAIRWPVTLAIAFAIVASYALTPDITSGDVGYYFVPWLRHAAEHGFGEPFSNYTPPYLYLLWLASWLPLDPLDAVKLVSLAGVACAGFAVYRLAAVCGARYPVEAGLWAMFLPTLRLNATVLVQADGYWVALCILAVAAAVQGRTLATVVFSGLAFAFKAQAMFLAPFVAAFLIVRRAPLWHWAVPPAVYALAMLPAFLSGWPAWHLATIYLRQAQWQPPGEIFVSNAASLWTLVDAVVPAAAFVSVGVALAAAAALLLVVAAVRRGSLPLPRLLALASLSAALMPFLLPRMHERFTLLADLLTFVFAFVVRTRSAIAAAALMQLGSLGAVLGFIVQRPEPAIAGSLFAAAAIAILFRCTFDRRPASSPAEAEGTLARS